MSAIASVQLPRYKCHKEVWADSIAEMHQEHMILSAGIHINLVDSNGYTDLGNRVRVAAVKPKVGDYFVVYDDDYQSWSPKAVFEDGYALIT